jgi:hypothetical protein
VSLNAMIVVNALLDLAVVAGLAAVLLRPFVLERRGAVQVAELPRREALRRAA